MSSAPLSAHTARIAPTVVSPPATASRAVKALAYFMRLLDLRKASGLATFDVCYFFRAVVDRFADFGDEANCEVEDVKDEIFDMVKPADPSIITLSDLISCKVGDTVVGMLSDMHAFAAYDRREQSMDHGGGEGGEEL